MITTNRYIAQAEAGRRLGLSRPSVRSLMAAGAIPTEVQPSGTVRVLRREFDTHEIACRNLLSDKLVLPAYEQMVKASHTFNLLDARHAVSVTERQRYILRVRTLARVACTRLVLNDRALEALRRYED